MVVPVPARPLEIAVLISGNGSNLQAIIDAIKEGRLPAHIAAVISNRPDAKGLERAQREGLTTVIVDQLQYPDRENFDRALIEAIDRCGAALVVLAGFMRILTPVFVQHYQGRLLNIHPSLLPRFTGLNTHRRALEAGVSQHGASVHFVTEELDGGPLIMQAELTVNQGENAAQLAARVLALEHCLYPLVLRLYAEGRIEMREGVAYFDGRPLRRPLFLADFESRTDQIRTPRA